MFDFTARPLAGKKGIILGIANEHSIAYGCAQVFRGLGAEIGVTYTNDKARPSVEPLARALEASIVEPCDVRVPGQLEHVFQVAEQTWGSLDFALHSITAAPKQDLHAPLSQCSRGGFLQTMEVSCYSFIRMAHLAAPMMHDGGTILAMSYYGAEKVIEHYNVMGPVKAALEGAVRYLASELGPRGIRVHAISPGSVMTRAASGIEEFDELLEYVAALAPAHRLVTIDDVGAAAAYLATDYARLMTGGTIYVDGGYHIVG
ncbi:enoyl-ACP reductase FabI [Bradyrhizobium sp. CB2312]|uniref:enoyl-ACP reductase FabI n=1 Tax=Bradyrhizobium sp. CB2312 TaxID=3039155 RepID=UPI0024B06DA9|nr:enoyl-ACP reductase FabI [Bradyrhizobium sp. CB2312]WFU75563.1 enoyl-ACP reductase FabI [Bradyrhizobium sp. CB2312]